jgi:hypothetical protein
VTDVAEKTTMVPLGDREIEMRAPADAALVVMARVSRGLPKNMTAADAAAADDAFRERLIRNLGTLGKIVESMIVQDDDKDWLDDVMISGAVTTEQVFDAIRVCGEQLNGANAPKKPQAAVRRRA